VRVSATDPAEPRRRELPFILAVLTFTTGLVDAISYLELGGVFTAFQTANLVLLGFALAGTESFSIAPPAVSLVSFLAGATLGGRWALRLTNRHRRWFSIALAMEVVLVGLAIVAAGGLDADTLSDQRLLVIALLAAAMGLRTATVSQLLVPGLTTTVMTSTISAMAADFGSSGAGGGRRRRTVVTIAARVLGAAGGALLLELSVVLPVLLVAVLVGLSAVAYVMPVVLRRAFKRRRSRAKT
jgi:uncharacterized membrane protein YoaK (UPF0700 family)